MTTMSTALLLAISAFAAACLGTRIDIHHHIFPPDYVAYCKAAGEQSYVDEGIATYVSVPCDLEGDAEAEFFLVCQG